MNNRLAGQDEGDDAWKQRCERLFAALPREMPLGFYECPHPYKRLFTPELLRWCADTGRVRMFKDTCCDPEQIRLRQRAVDGTPLGIYNANAATLLETLREGIAGYSGVMANFHPQLYAWLCRNWKRKPAEAEGLQAWLGTASAIEGPLYPRNAKAFLQPRGTAGHYGDAAGLPRDSGPRTCACSSSSARSPTGTRASTPAGPRACSPRSP